MASLSFSVAEKPTSLFWYLLEHGPRKLETHLQSKGKHVISDHGGIERDIKYVV